MFLPIAETPYCASVKSRRHNIAFLLPLVNDIGLSLCQEPEVDVVLLDELRGPSICGLELERHSVEDVQKSIKPVRKSTRLVILRIPQCAAHLCAARWASRKHRCFLDHCDHCVVRGSKAFIQFLCSRESCTMQVLSHPPAS